MHLVKRRTSFTAFSSPRCLPVLLVVAAFGCGSKQNDDGPRRDPEGEQVPPPAPPLPEVVIGTETPFVVAPAEVEIYWVTDAPTATFTPASGRTSDHGPLPRHLTIVPVTETTTFTVTATNENGTTSKSVTVNVVPGVATNLEANHLVCDPARGKLLVSVATSDRLHANTIAVVDAATGAVEKTTPIGSSPNRLALSDDGTTLWVGVDGASSFRKLDTRTGAVGPLVPLPNDPSPTSPPVADQIVALEGDANAIAVTVGLKDRIGQEFAVAVYDDGVMRAKKLEGDAATIIARGAGATELFGYATSPELRRVFSRFTLDATGIAVGQRSDTRAEREVPFTYAEGQIYLATGVVLDANVFSTLGTYKMAWSGPTFPDVANKTVYRASGVDEIVSFDISTFVPRGKWSTSAIGFSEIVGCGESVGVIGTIRRHLGIREPGAKDERPKLYVIPKAAIR